MIIKKLKLGLFMATIGLCSITTWAAMATEMVSIPGLISNETIWEDETEAPLVRINLEDVYQSAGKTEKIIIRLEGASWADGNGTSLVLKDYENITRDNISLLSRGEQEIQFNIEVPSDIQEDEMIGFTLPLMVSVQEEIAKATIQRLKEDKVLEERKVVFATTSNKKITYSIEEVTEFVGEGVLGPIKFTEIRPYALEGKNIVITIELQNEHFIFREPEYLSKTINQDTIDYIVDGTKYLEYEGAFKNNNHDLKVKMHHATDRIVELQIKAEGHSDIGSVVVKGLPIQCRDGNKLEEEILITLESDSLINLDKDIIAARSQEKTREEKLEEEAIIKKQEEEEKIREEQRQEEMERLSNQAAFTIGKNTYMAGGQEFEMDVTPYIETPGLVMIPVRYAALALGVDEKDIKIVNDTVFLKYGNKAIELTKNSKVARVNNANIIMAAEVVVKHNRVYVPIGELAKLMSVKKTWNPEEKTATFHR